MAFKLTLSHAHSILDPCATGNWEPFRLATDPAVRWWIVDDAYDASSKSGIYTFASWKELVNGPLLARLEDEVLRVRFDTLDVVGNKVIGEASGFATQRNGRPYNNKFAWFLMFSEETGKIVEIREYMNSALVKEVHETNEAL